MNNIVHKIMAAVAAALLLASCSDFLDKQPSNELTEEQVFSDWYLMVQFHQDTYNFLRHGAGRIDDTWLDAATDLAHTSFTGGVTNSFNVGNYYGGGGGNELSGTWEHYYRGIRKCNMILERIESVPQSPDLTDATYLELKAWVYSEARFLRAWFYWEMFLRYGPVPIVREVLDPNGDLMTGYTTRPTVREFVVDFILGELSAAENGTVVNGVTYRLMEKGKDTDSQASRITRPMASALRSRILLYMASPRFANDSGVTWRQAADAAQEFITNYGGGYGLVAGNDPKDGLTKAWLLTPYTESNNEIIFYRNDTTVGWAAVEPDTPVGEGGRGGLSPSQNLIDMYDMIDGSSPFAEYDATGAPVYNGLNPTVNPASGYSDATMWTGRDTRLAASVLHHGATWNGAMINVILGQRDNPVGNAWATPTGYYVRKFIPETILAANHTGNSRRLWTIIRYAEIKLNLAEALNEAEGPGPVVWQMLDDIRRRAGITGSVADRTDLDTKEKMRNFIRKERTVELAFEEHRPWDVRRWNVAAEALGRNIIGVNVAADGSITRKVATTRVFQPKMYLYPIPEAEYWKTGIENNPEW